MEFNKLEENQKGYMQMAISWLWQRGVLTLLSLRASIQTRSALTPFCPDEGGSNFPIRKAAASSGEMPVFFVFCIYLYIETSTDNQKEWTISIEFNKLKQNKKRTQENGLTAVGSLSHLSHWLGGQNWNEMVVIYDKRKNVYFVIVRGFNAQETAFNIL
jgi:hypothetical protein